MDIMRSRFRVGLDGSPFSSTVVMEVYEDEETGSGLGYLKEMESLDDMKKRSPENLLAELEPEEYEFRFELDEEELGLYDQIFRNAVKNYDFEDPFSDALYSVEVFSSPNDGIEKDSEMVRYTGDDVPGDVIKAFSILERTAYENII